MELRTSLIQVLAEPTPDALWRLRGELLELGLASDSDIMSTLHEFYQFLNELVASSTAREFSHFASIMDMAAVAGVAVQNLLNIEDSEDWWKRFMMGGASEGLMVLAARQYVKAWEEEMRASYNASAWYLSQEYWELSARLRPDLPLQARRQLVDRLLVPIQDAQVEGIVKAGLIVRLFQVLLLARFKLISDLSGDRS
jgi:hypothetical protein